MIPVEGKKWEKAKRSLFGPKVFDFHTSLNTHLLGRTVVEDMEPDDSVDRAMDAEKKARHLLPVRLWLAAESKLALGKWSRERVDALWDSPDFRKRVGRMRGKTGRDHIIAAIMLLVSEVLGWDFENDVQRILARRKTMDEWSEEEEVREAIDALRGSTPTTEVRTEDVLMFINDRRAKLRLGPMSPKGLGAILGDLGYKRDSPDWYKAKSGAYRDQRVIIPHPPIEEGSQGSEGSQKQDLLHMEETEKSGPMGLVGPEAHEEGKGAKAQATVAKEIRDTIKALVGRDEGAARDDIVYVLEGNGISPETIDSFLERWREDGTLICPKPGLYRLAREGGRP